jgi:hypothetical protein
MKPNPTLTRGLCDVPCWTRSRRRRLFAVSSLRSIVVASENYIRAYRWCRPPRTG